MYADPRHIRNHAIKVSFSSVNHEKIEQLAMKNGREKSVLAHELSLIGLEMLEKYGGDMKALARAI